MLVDLSKEDLVSLVCGSSPSYEVMGHELIDKCGSYIGGFHDRWNWDTYSLMKLSEVELLTIYEVLKKNK